MKKILIFLLVIFNGSSSEATIMNKNARVAVMDMGTHEGVSDPDFDLLNAEQSSSEYIIQQLMKSKYFTLIDKDVISNKLKTANIKITGLIPPNTAKQIGELLNVDYIIYGNVVNVGLDEAAEGIVRIRTVKSNLVIRIMDVKTGKILMAAKGEGKSKSASVLEDIKFFVIGTIKVSQTSVHNALQKAAFQSVDVLIERLFGKSN